MVINNLQVNKAYMNALNSVTKADAKASSALGTEGDATGSFGSMISDTVNKVVASGQASDAKIMSQAVGKVDVVDVVTAVAETEIAVQTLVSVRDRVISAYQDILRMPI